MRFADECDPTEAELRAWASGPDAAEPIQDWDLVLAWGMEPGRLRLLAELASDPSAPNARFFLRCLYAWVAVVAGRPGFEAWRPQFDLWLGRVGSIRGPSVRRWRHRARRLFQGVDEFDRETWWDGFERDGDPA